MRKRIFKGFAAVLLSSTLTVSTVFAVFADDVDKLKQQKQQTQQELVIFRISGLICYNRWMIWNLRWLINLMK